MTSQFDAFYRGASPFPSPNERDGESVFSFGSNLPTPFTPVDEVDPLEKTTISEILAAPIPQNVFAAKGSEFVHNWPSTISQRIENIAIEQPNAVAIQESCGKSMSYQEVMGQVNRVGSSLLGHRVRPGSMIAVLCEPTWEYICALLAILRLGAVYVPLDNLHPNDRLAVIANDCKAEVIICQDSTVARVPAMNLSVPIINVSNLSSSREVPIDVAYDGTAFVLYSSGTTGTPKGIMLSQRNALNQLVGWHHLFEHSKERILQQAALGFDASLFEVLYAFAYGGVVLLANKEIRNQPLDLAKFMLQEQATYTVAVCSEYVALLRYGGEILKQCKSWKYAFSGGERLTASLKAQFRSIGLMDLKLINMYGPTEIAYCSAYGIVPYHDEDIWDNKNGSRVGGMFPNYSHYICDENMQALPPNTPGEICVAGVGVGLGYLNPEQSAKKFLVDKFATEKELRRGYGRLYRSGDKGQMLEDGTLMFLGRMEGDAQAKLNGVRVDLEDVGNTILTHAKGVLCEVVVMVRGTIDPFMVAFAVLEDQRPLDQAQEYLRTLLTSMPIPLNMRPAIIIPLDSMPRNVNGKVDKKALARMTLPQQSTPRSKEELTVAEAQLKALWSSILSDGKLGFQITRSTDFFDVGGNSILMINLRTLIAESFGANVSLHDLFDNTTLKRMARRIEKTSTESSTFDQIDWNQEIEVALGQLQPTPSQVILLIGAENFIGESILHYLAADPTVREIHCLAMPSEASPSNETASPKIIHHTGVLSSPSFSLSPTLASSLAQKATQIIHAGASFSFLKPYQTLRASNVSSTLSAIQLSLLSDTPNRVPVHYISTSAVKKFSEGVTGGLERRRSSLSLSEPPTDGSDGYVASRWASEQLLEAAARKYGIDVQIHRIAGVTSEKAPETDLLNAVLKYSKVSKTVPDLEGWEGKFDYQPLELVAGKLVKEVLGGAREGGEFGGRRGVAVGLKTYKSGKGVLAVELGAKLEEETGEKFEKVELQNWVLEASRSGMNHLVASYLNILSKLCQGFIYLHHID
ncbi:putative NRPS-like protein biosynthetic cluster [Bacidia gigantensis]|uniref:putative NRPS-like protein biosynthetic cluster n=1 Tax=Bacidia gigantensis TaxID=2732470 RepID=UPI001D03F925|nr:putative NRPS-like protein biosynthetic cluster [Bacidia gigantensis]KAG8527823.1 putative NRPS-like protein biosynthetic cluster [Bacidia gigantensis]